MIVREDIKFKLANGEEISLSQVLNAYRNLIFRNKLKTETDIDYNLRKLRHFECFPIVDRGTLWYNELSDEQHFELKQWRQQWLDVTDTHIIPVTPTWINNKLEGETIL